MVIRVPMVLHPNVWLPIIAIGAALWGYTEIVSDLLARVGLVSGVVSIGATAGAPVTRPVAALLVVAVAMVAAYAGAQALMDRYAGLIGLRVAALIPVALTAHSIGITWAEAQNGSVSYALASSALFLVGDVAASILVYVAYMELVPSPFNATGDPAAETSGST